jgi:hypothetical protein
MAAPPINRTLLEIDPQRQLPGPVAAVLRGLRGL